MRGKYSCKQNALSKSRDRMVATRFAPDERAVLNAMCDRNKISRSDAIRKILLGIDEETFKKYIMA